MNTSDPVDAKVREMFGNIGDDATKPKQAELKQTEPQQKSAEPDFGGNIGQMAGAAIGSFFGPMGTTVGGAVGGFASESASKLVGAPQGPGATISGGTVNVTDPVSDHAAETAGHIADLAKRGIQTRMAPAGQGKVY